MLLIPVASQLALANEALVHMMREDNNTNMKWNKQKEWGTAQWV